MQRTYDKKGLPGGANTSKRGLNLLAALVCVPFLYIAFIDKGVYLDQNSKQVYKGPRAADFVRVSVSDEHLAKSRIRIWVKNESAPEILFGISRGLCWFDLVDGHGVKRGGTRAECDSPPPTP